MPIKVGDLHVNWCSWIIIKLSYSLASATVPKNDNGKTAKENLEIIEKFIEHIQVYIKYFTLWPNFS